MATAPELPATPDDLARLDGKAELIGGRIAPLMPTGFRPSRVAGRVFRALDDRAEATGRGDAFAVNTGFAVPRLPSGRGSFSPDAAYYDGPMQADPARFVPGPPTLAVEVRSEHDHGPRAEAEMAARRADYLAAGTRVVRDVDPRAERVHVYRADAPATPATHRRGERAEAEPALPGWGLDVDSISS